MFEDLTNIFITIQLFQHLKIIVDYFGKEIRNCFGYVSEFLDCFKHTNFLHKHCTVEIQIFDQITASWILFVLSLEIEPW